MMPRLSATPARGNGLNLKCWKYGLLIKIFRSARYDFLEASVFFSEQLTASTWKHLRKYFYGRKNRLSYLTLGQPPQYSFYG